MNPIENLFRGAHPSAESPEERAERDRQHAARKAREQRESQEAARAQAEAQAKGRAEVEARVKAAFTASELRVFREARRTLPPARWGEQYWFEDHDLARHVESAGTTQPRVRAKLAAKLRADFRLRQDILAWSAEVSR